MSAVGEAVKAFAVVFPAELPDKTMITTLVLTTRYRMPRAVVAGAAAAFAMHVVVAVAAGRLLSLLPPIVVGIATATLFGIGAIVLWRESTRDEPDEDLDTGADVVGPTFWSVALKTFALVGIAEWGDLTQLTTASLAARSAYPVAVGIGAWLALVSVAVLASTVGHKVFARFRPQLIQRVAACVFAGLAIWTIIELI